MAITLGINGFEFQNAGLDGIEIISGGVLSYNAGVPDNSRSTRSLATNGATLFMKWNNGATATAAANSPGAERYVFGFQGRVPSNDANNDALRIGVSDGVDEIVTLSRENATGYTTLRVNGAVVVTSAHIWETNVFERFIVDVNPGVYVRVYVDGDLSTPIIDHTLVASMDPPTGFYVASAAAHVSRVDDMWAIEVESGDPSNILRRYISVSVGLAVPNAAGTYTDGTGGVAADLAEVPPNDATGVEFALPDEASTYGFSVTNLDPILLATKVAARVTRSGTDAGEECQIRLVQGGDELDLPAAQTAAPGDGHVILVSDVDGAGAPWTLANFTSGEIGFVTRETVPS